MARLHKHKIVLASSNPGKIKEFSELLKGLSIRLVSQEELCIPAADETGLSFVENAILKARHASSLAQLPAIGDDSGLIVPALNGEPGIYSARYAGPNANAAENIQKLLNAIKKIPKQERLAYFHCVLVYMSHGKDPAPLICEGRWEGVIVDQPKGEHGFGYDPIFYVKADKRTAAELSPGRKNKLSHRAKALRLLLTRLPEKLCMR